jgi:hypothetical protein
MKHDLKPISSCVSRRSCIHSTQQAPHCYPHNCIYSMTQSNISSNITKLLERMQSMRSLSEDDSETMPRFSRSTTLGQDEDAQDDSDGGLLENWPTRNASAHPRQDALNRQETTAATASPTPPRKRVRFAKNAYCFLFTVDPHHDTTNAYYTSKDRKEFTREALNEAKRIRRLLSTIVLPDSDSPSSSSSSLYDRVEYCLDQSLILPEDLMGLEHVVLGVGLARLLKERREHAERLLMIGQQRG